MRLKLKHLLASLAFADLALVGGIVVLAVGVGLVYFPAGLITGGLCIVALAVLTAR